MCLCCLVQNGLSYPTTAGSRQENLEDNGVEVPCWGSGGILFQRFRCVYLIPLGWIDAGLMLVHILCYTYRHNSF